MLPGPTVVRRCPSCGGRFLHPTIASGNTFGARLWSDGYFDAPMLPTDPPFVFVSCCSRVIALCDSETLDVLRDQSPFEPVAGLEYWESPGVPQLLAALAELREPRDRRVTLLQQLWFRANDARRSRKPGPVRDLAAPVAAALEELLDLYDLSDSDQRLGHAELCRELGRFDEALETLAEPLDGDCEPFAAQVRAWSGERDPRLKVFAT